MRRSNRDHTALNRPSASLPLYFVILLFHYFVTSLLHYLVYCSARPHASAYLYPVPVLNKTTRSSGRIHPEAASFRAALTVAAPSGAAKTPSSDASSLPASSISSSLTVNAVPRVCRSIRK